MNESERVALNWARRFLRGHHCPQCGREWITAASVGTLMHSCPGTLNKGGGYDWRPPRQRHDDQRTDWARGLLGPLAEAVEHRDGEDALLRGEGDQ